MLLIRAFDTRRLIPIRWNVTRFSVSLLTLAVQGVILVAEPRWWIPAELLLTAFMLSIHGRQFMFSIKHILRRKRS